MDEKITSAPGKESLLKRELLGFKFVRFNKL
jgi:hypothetical protein